MHDLLAQHWHRERLWVHLMTAMFRLGRRGDALAALREAEARLVEDLTIEPGAELRAAERAVLSNDPALFGVPLRPGTVPAALAPTAPACLGRDQELEWLLAALDMAATRRAQARLVVGSAGIGKTRLMAEVARRAAERGVAIRYGTGDPESSWSIRDALLVEHDRLNLIILDDLDLAPTDDVVEVARFIRSHVDRPVLTLPTCRDPVRVGELAGLPKLVLAGLGDAAVADIVRVYAPSTTDAAAVAAMANTGGVPAKLHRAASEWAFGRAGRRIDRAAAAVAEPARWLTAVRDEVVAGVLELDHVRRSARPLRPQVRPAVGCPYRGLARYEADHAELFRGRERAVAEVLARMVGTPLVAVVGPAGTGKSSLLRAGVLPAVASGVLPDSARWRQLLVTPSSAAELALRLSEVDEPDIVDEESAELTELADVADFDAGTDIGDPEPDDQVEESPVDEAPPVPSRTVLVVDQFEEAFSLVPAARGELFATLVDATASGDVTVVLVIRSDAYPRCAEHPELGRLIAANTMLLAAMGTDELRQAIEEPATTSGVRVEPALVDALIADTPAAGLPALSAGLATLWAQRVDGELCLSAYRSAGGLARAVEQLGERAYASLSPTQRVEAVDLLTAAAGGRVSPERAGAGVLAVLREYGLVSVVDGQVELVHESLPQRWPRLGGWLAEQRAERELRTQLSQSARDWVDGGRDPQALYGGARLAAAVDYSAEHEVGSGEREFLAAGQRVLFAADQRRRRQVTRLWYVIVVLALILVTTVAAGVMVFLAWQSAAATNQQTDAVRLAQRGPADPDLRGGLRLAAAAATVDGSAATTEALRATLARSPDLIATGGDAVTAAAISPDGLTIAAGAATGDVWLFHAADLSPISHLDYPDRAPVLGLAFTAGGSQLVGWGGAHTGPTASIVVWNVGSGQVDGAPFGQPWPDGGGGLLADGDTLVLAQHGPGSAPIAWSLAARTPSTAYELPASATVVLVAPDGSAVAFGTPTAVEVVSVPSGHTTTLHGTGAPLALGPAGHTLLTLDSDGVGLWDVGTATRTGMVPATGVVSAAAWSTDGSAFATGTTDGTITVYDTTRHAPTRTLIGDRRAVQTIHFGLDGQTLYTAGTTGALMAWDLTGTRGVGAGLGSADRGALVAQACRLAGRDLTPDEWSADVPDFSYRKVCAG